MRIHDRLEGNQEALDVRERYREVVSALSRAQGAFVARYEIKMNVDGTCVLIVTSSKGEDCDLDLCNAAVAVMTAITGIKPAVDDAAAPSEGQADG